MKKQQSKRMLKDILGREYAVYLVIILFVLFLKTVYFFMAKIGATTSGMTKFYIDYRNDFPIELFFSVLAPILLVLHWFEGLFKRNDSDMLHVLPITRAQRTVGCLSVLGMIQFLNTTLNLLTDAILGKWASAGFCARYFLPHKYGMLWLTFLISAMISLLAITAASNIGEYVFYAAALLLTEIVLIGLGLYYCVEVVQGRLLLQNNGNAIVLYGLYDRVIEQCKRLVFFPTEKAVGAVYSVLLPAAIVSGVPGILLFSKRPAERAEGMNRCFWIRAFLQAMLPALFGVGLLWEIVLIRKKEDEIALPDQMLFFIITLDVCLFLSFLWEGFYRKSIRKIWYGIFGFLMGCILLVVLFALFRNHALELFEHIQKG